MIKTLLITFIITYSWVGYSQQFGATSGTVFSNVLIKRNNQTIRGNTRTGFTLGALSDIPFSKGFSFVAALNWIQKGFTYKNEANPQNPISESLTLQTAELPSGISYNVKYGRNTFFLGGGPVLTLLLSARYNTTDNIGSRSETPIIGGEGGDLTRFELGAHANAGAYLGRSLYVALHYNRSLTNSSIQEGIQFFNNYYALRLGFIFHGTK